MASSTENTDFKQAWRDGLLDVRLCQTARTLRGEVAEVAVQQAAVAIAHRPLRWCQKVAVFHQRGR